MSAKILAAPSGQKVTLDGTEALPITGSQYCLTAAIVSLALLQNLGAFAATTSAQLAAKITDETGSGALVFAANPVLVTPNLGTPSAAVLTNATGLPLTTGVTGTLGIANGGTGQTSANAAFNALSPMTTGGDLIYGGAAGAATRLANGSAGQVLTSNGTTLAPSWQTPSTGLTVGTTTIASGTTTRILYDNAGVLGEYTITGTGTVAVMQTGASLITPALGVASGTSLALGGATIGTDAFAVNGSTTHNGNFSIVSASLILSGNISATAWTTNGLRIKGIAATLTDTTSSGTVATAYTDVLGGNTIAASSAATYTNYFSMYVKDPVTGTNVTMTNKWSLGGDSLKVGTSTPLTVTTAGALSAISGNFGGGTLFSGTQLTVTGVQALIAASGQEPRLVVGITTDTTLRISFGLDPSNNPFFQMGPGGATNRDVSLMRLGVGNLRIGNIPSATPVAQLVTIGEASRGGTDTNVAGANGTLQSGAGTGSGTGSSLIFQTPTTGTTGTAAQTYATRLTLTDLAATFTVPITTSGVSATIASGTAIPAGGTAGTGYKLSSTSNFGIFFGSSSPTLAAAKGSLYLRSDGSGATDRAYINTDGSTAWTNIVTAG